MFGWFKKPSVWESPIGEPDKIDLIANRRDGGVELYVVVSSRMDGSEATRDVFERKIRNYCQYVSSADFAEEFGVPSPKRVCICVHSKWEVPESLILLLSRIGAEENVPAELAVRYQ